MGLHRILRTDTIDMTGKIAGVVPNSHATDGERSGRRGGFPNHDTIIVRIGLSSCGVRLPIHLRSRPSAILAVATVLPVTAIVTTQTILTKACDGRPFWLFQPS